MGVLGRGRELVRDVVEQAAGRVGLGHSEERLATDARAYWTGAEDDHWLNNSHFRRGRQLESGVWDRIGDGHWELFTRLARIVEFDGRIRRAVEWGCGGGANAVTFAPQCSEAFVGVDIAQRTLEECAQQVKNVTGTAFVPVLADVLQPEASIKEIGRCDVFLSLYVLELAPSQDYGLRVMRIAHEVLDDGGLAFVQIKYDTGHWRTAPRRRGYRASVLGSMTTYPIHEFWTAMREIGFQPEAVHLVPENELDSRYAYFLLRKA